MHLHVRFANICACSEQPCGRRWRILIWCTWQQ